MNPPCVTFRSFVRANFAKGCLSPLTGTDFRALDAAIQIIAMLAYDRSPEAIEAFGKVVGRMQPHCQWIAYQAIAHGIDWSERDSIWAEAGLPVVSSGHRAFKGRFTRA